MKRRLSASAQRDERVALMLDRHVRGKGSAPTLSIIDRLLRRKVELLLVRS
jgi:hypothetical protein